MVNRRQLLAIAGTGLVAAVMQPARAGVTQDEVAKAITEGVKYLKSEQDERGNWNEMTAYPGGVTALVTLALLSCGESPDDPTVARALRYLREDVQTRSKTYSTALKTIVYANANPKRYGNLIETNVRWLESIQIKSGIFNGAWGYGREGLTGDNSNAQFALLGLYEAERAGITVKQQTWNRALQYWQRQQNRDGSWKYRPTDSGGTGSMTCAGIASVLICSGQVSHGDAQVAINGEVQCCGLQEQNDEIQQGLDWMGRNFSVRRNPGSMRGMEKIWWFYYLYALERVGRLSGQRFIGQHDWFREGAEMLVGRQEPGGSWRTVSAGEADPHVATAYALLFLAKGRRPVLISKLKRLPDTDWNHHRSDMAHLTRYVEERWKKDMSWQVVNIEASVEDLLQTPVLFISGRDGLPLLAEHKDKLAQYVQSGGFIFAENCCDGIGFDKAFRQLMKDIFPESRLRLLPSDHPIWYAEQKVNPDYARPLMGVEACCRTSVVYSPKDLSCYWELARRKRGQKYLQEVQDEIDACLAIGANVLAYATNRELRDKLDTPQVATTGQTQGSLQRSTLQVAKLQHNGGSDDAPAALSNLLRATSEQLQLRVDTTKWLLPTDAPNLPDFPIAFIHGRRNFRLAPQQREALARYVNNGGTVFGDSICAGRAFTDAIKRECRAAFPDETWSRIPIDHEMFTAEFGGADIRKVAVRRPRVRVGDGPLATRTETVAPHLEGIEIDGRWAVIFSPLDISCALENQASIECKGYTRQDAARIGINVLLYAMQN